MPWKRLDLYKKDTEPIFDLRQGTPQDFPEPPHVEENFSQYKQPL